VKVSHTSFTITRTSILAALPWAFCLLVFSGTRVTLSFLVTCIVLTFAGLALLRVLVPALPLDTAVLLSLPAGLLEASFLSALAARFGIDLLVPAVFLLLMSLMGAWFVFRLRRELVALARTSLPRGGLVVLLSALICVVYFLPSVLWDGTFRPDGSFGWLYTDCQWFMAMTNSILRGGSPPDLPGLAGSPMWYHYGRMALAAMVHRVSLCNVADSLFRIVGGVGRISLALSTLALGAALGATQGKRWAAGVAAVFGMFFVGDLSWPLRALAEAGKFHVIPSLPQMNWESFAHILFGHSLLWGTIGVFVVLSVLFESSLLEGGGSVSPGLAFFPALVVPMHGVAALGAAGVSWMELGIRFRRRISYIAAIGLGIAVTALVFWVLLNPIRVAGNAFSLDPDPRPAFFEMFVYFFLGFGVLLLGFDWFRSFPKTAPSRVLLVFMAGFIPFTVIFENRDFNDYYGVRFATVMLTVFAMARLGIWIGDDPILIARRVLRRLGAAATGTAGVFMVVGLAVILVSGPGSKRVAMLPVLAAVGAFGGLVLIWLSRKGRAVVAGGAVIIGSAFVLQSIAWVPVFVSRGIRKVAAHSLSAGEVKGLLHLREVSGPKSLCVTNRHKIPGMRFEPARSYMYTALSGRAFVLEGWEFRERLAPGFQDARRLSKQIFSTRDPELLCEILKHRGVGFIVARPGTDLHVSGKECNCIQKVPDCGSLTVYRVRSTASHLD